MYPRLTRLGVRLLAQQMVEAIEPNGDATIRGIWGGQEEAFPIDSVVLVMGRRPETTLFRALRSRTGAGVRRIGDCLAPREVDRAIYEGEKAGRVV